MATNPDDERAHRTEMDHAAMLMGILVDALTAIADASPDPLAREMAREALAEYHGR